MLGELHTLRAQWQEAQRAAEEQERLEAELAEAQERIAALAPLEAQLQGLTRQVEEGQQQESQLLKELDLTRAELTRMAEAQQAAQTPQAEPSALAAAESALADAQAELAAQAETLAALRERLAGAERQLAEAKIKDRADREVIASLTQELRQPMSSITGYADLLLSESVGIIGALQRKFLERIKASTERMGALLDDLLNVTAINVGELRLEHESLDVAKVVEEAVQSCATQFREKEITLRMDMPEDLPRLNADRDALRQILTHLLNNASSASAVNSEILLTVQHEVERPRIGDPAHYLFISMSDTGGGIAPEDQPRVFSRLYRADAPLVAGVGDTGVGLSMVKALVEAHGGRVWVISEQGVGSTFYVLMPLEHSPAKPNNNGAAPPP
ncbi:MAG: sensor histidine kinase, partial [Anaerolineales bacterium]